MGVSPKIRNNCLKDQKCKWTQGRCDSGRKNLSDSKIAAHSRKFQTVKPRIKKEK
jgi:hypothetical protein